MRDRNGFTLVELISVIVILCLLLMLVVPSITNVADRSNTTLKDSKIKTIESIGEKYGNAAINKYKNCDGSASETILKNECTVSVSELVMRGYIESEDEEYNVLNPVTRKPFDGKVLMCYNPATIKVEASYVEDDSQYKCSAVDLETGASLNLSAISGKGYVGGKPIEVNIIKSGIERDGLRCESSDENLVTCDASSSSKLKMNIVSSQFDEPYKEAKVTLYAKTKNGELEQTYTAMIYSTDLKIDGNDNANICLPQGESAQFGIVSKNAGDLSVSSSDDSILLGDINQTVLTVMGGEMPGEATLTVREANGNLESSLTRRVYSLKPENGIPDALLLGNKRVIKLNYGGNDSVTVTSDTPHIIKISSAKQKESDSITLTGEDEFTIDVIGTGEAHLTITGNPCGKIEKTITISNLYIKEKKGEVYIGGDSFRTEVISGNNNTYSCKSSDENVATCKIEDSFVEVIPNTVAGLAKVTISGDKGGEDTVLVNVVKTSLALNDKDGNPVSYVCSSTEFSGNDREAILSYENIGNLSISEVSDRNLGMAVLANEQLVPTKTYLDDIAGLDGYKVGYNTGILHLKIKEANGNVEVPLDYYIYDIEAPYEEKQVTFGKPETIDVPSFASGPLSVSIEDTEVANVSLENEENYSYDLNAKNMSKLSIIPLKTGETNVTIRGERCGVKTFKLKVVGKIFKISIEKGTYTDFIGDIDEKELSCQTKGTADTCVVTFPDFKVKSGFEVNGYSTTKNKVDSTYKVDEVLTLDSENTGTTYYANAIVKKNPVCEFRKPLTSINTGETNTVTMMCNEASRSESILSIDDFVISNPAAAEILSVGEPVEIVDEYGREGYTYKIEIAGKDFGSSFDLSLNEGVFVDEFGKKNTKTDFTSILVGKYNSYKFWYVGKDNPQDAVAVLYMNKDLPDEISSKNDDSYTLILYGNGATKDFNTGSDGDIPPWIPPGYQEFISQVIVEEGISEIGNAIFYALYNLESITIPEGVTKIGESAFSFAQKIKNVTFPSTLTGLGKGAFEYCTSLEHVNFNKGLETIEDYAFRTTHLKEIFIPNSVIKIGPYAFLTELSGSSEAEIEIGEPQLTKIEFEEDSKLSTISNGAFKNHCASSLKIPSSVVFIGPNAFEQDMSIKTPLKHLNFEENSNLEVIYQSAFFYNQIEDTLIFPDKLEEIGADAFYGMTGKSVHLGPKVKTLGNNFAIGDNIEEYVVSEENPYFSSVDGVLYNKTGTELIKYPVNYYALHTELNIPEGTTTLGNSAFGGWVKILKERKDFVINMPSSLVNLNLDSNFSVAVVSAYNIDNENYKSVDGVLYNADLTTAYRLPGHYDKKEYTVLNSIKIIDDYFAFGNISVETLTIPESVEKLGYLSLSTDPNYSFKNIYFNVSDEVLFDETTLITYPSSGDETVYSKNIYIKTDFMKNRLTEMYEESIDDFKIIIVKEGA